MAGLGNVARVSYRRAGDVGTTGDTRCCICSYSAEVVALLRARRNRCGVENGLYLYWTSRLVKNTSGSVQAHADQNLSVVCRLASNPL